MSAPRARKAFAPILVDSDIIIVANPVAGNGKSRRYVSRLGSTIARMVSDGSLRIAGSISYLMTDADPEVRVRAIADAIAMSQSPNPPYVIAVGGDGTFADAGAGALIAAEEGATAIIVPTNAGTACDMRRELGVPRDPEKLFHFLATALPIELSAISVWMDGGPERILLHSLGLGVSGAVFHEVENIVSAGGKSTISTYLRGLAKGVAQTKPFFASVDGSDPIAVGEVLALSNSTSVGGVTRVPLPEFGGRIHFVPVDPDKEGLAMIEPGLTALADVFARGMSYMMGDQRVIAPGEEIPILAAGRTVELLPGDSREIVFTDAAGNPVKMKAILNGDAAGEAGVLTMTNAGKSIESLAAADSSIMVRRGEALPKSTMDRVHEYADGVGDRIAVGVNMNPFAGVMMSDGAKACSGLDRFSADDVGPMGLGTYLNGNLPFFMPSAVGIAKPF